MTQAAASETKGSAPERVDVGGGARRDHTVLPKNRAE